MSIHLFKNLKISMLDFMLFSQYFCHCNGISGFTKVGDMANRHCSL